MRTKTALLLTILVLLGLSALLFFFGSMPPSARGGGPMILNWRQLRLLDYQSGEAPLWLQNMSGHDVRIPGFIVPLEDNYREVSEFLLVPDEGSCIHVPPPPPNQMVYVKMKTAHAISPMGYPMWVTGTLKIENVRSPFGTASYSVEGTELVPYKSQKQFESRGEQ